MNIDLPSVVIINGSQGSGKSSLIRYLIGLKKDELSYGIIFSNTAFSSEENYDYIPEKYVHPHFNEEKLLNLMKIQTKFKKETRPKIFIIFDDCLFEPKQWSSNALRQLATQVRHYNCFLIVSTQYPQLVPSYFRAVSFYSFIFAGMENKNAMKALYDSYGISEFNSYQEFQNYVIENTGDYKFIFIDRKTKTQFKIMKCPSNINKFKLIY